MDFGAYTPFVSGSFALLGVFLSGLMARLQRKEKLNEAIRDKKIEFYQGLVAKMGAAFTGVLVGKRRYISEDEFSDHAKIIFDHLISGMLYASDEVRKMCSEFVTLCEVDGIDIDTRLLKMSPIFNALRKRCCAELGVNRINGFFKKPLTLGKIVSESPPKADVKKEGGVPEHDTKKHDDPRDTV